MRNNEICKCNKDNRIFLDKDKMKSFKMYIK